MQTRVSLVLLGMALMTTEVVAQNTFPSSGDVEKRRGKGMMRKFGNWMWLFIVLAAAGATAQTNVTNNNDGNSGTAYSGTGAIPVYTGATTLGNSVITQWNGNVGIGMTSPATPLDIATGSVFGGNQIYNALTVQPASGSSYSANGASILLDSVTNYGIQPVAGIWSYLGNGGDGGVNYSGALVFGTTHQGSPSPTEGMRLDPSGNVGIGTTNATSKLTVNGGNATAANAIFNNLELQLAGFTGTYTGIGTGILFDTAANGGATNAPVGQVTGYLTDGGSSGSNYAGNLGFAAKGETTSAPVERMTINGSTGYVGIGTTSPGAKLEINGGLRFTNDPSGAVQTTAWTGVLCGGDYAEAVDVAGDSKRYEPGDVLVLAPGASGEVAKSSEPYSTLVSGIYATKPGVIGRRETLIKSSVEVPMAMIGIVPTKVTSENGPIQRGDLLVTSFKPGYAMKGTDRSRLVGAVIGKAVGSLDSGIGVIEVLVTLQ